MAATAARKSASAPRKRRPVAFFPAHWAPNDLLIYTGKAFPAAYRGGAFVAFHGSWNRAPAPQGGYNVVFQPLNDGKAAGNFIVFADGFAGAVKEPGRAAFRPSGLALGPDGALFISDDVHGRIWRVTSHGDADAPVAPAPARSSPPRRPAKPDRRKASILTRVDALAASLPVAARCDERRRSRSAIASSTAKRRAAPAPGCHGSDARGGAQAPSLVNGQLAPRATVASDRLRERLSTACRSRRTIRTPCRPRAARRCPTPMLSPSPLTSGRSATAATSEDDIIPVPKSSATRCPYCRRSPAARRRCGRGSLRKPRSAAARWRQ